MSIAPEKIEAFFANSEGLDREVLKPLSHIFLNWEMTWDHDNHRYEPEEDSFAEKFNALVKTMAHTPPPARYHDNEDRLAEYVVRSLKWPISKVKGRWIGRDYASILEQGGFNDINQEELLAAATGRVHAAIRFGQTHYDQVEEGHRAILSSVLTIILYHRSDDCD